MGGTLVCAGGERTTLSRSPAEASRLRGSWSTSTRLFILILGWGRWLLDALAFSPFRSLQPDKQALTHFPRHTSLPSFLAQVSLPVRFPVLPL